MPWKWCGVRIASIVTHGQAVTGAVWIGIAPTEKGKTMLTNKAVLAIVFKNIVCMICWTVLAIYFGRWWIALFSMLSFTSIEWRKKDND
jgi:hypothetical protein